MWLTVGVPMWGQSITIQNFPSEVCQNAPPTVTIASTGVFGPSNVYTVELSDASGDFSSPIQIGSIIDNSNTPPSITLSFSSRVPYGNNYQIRVTSSDPSDTSSVSGPVTIYSLNPGVHSTSEVTVCDGYDPPELTFTTSPSGGQGVYTYQWYENGVPVGNNDSYDPGPLSAGPDGTDYVYYCLVTDECNQSLPTASKTIHVVNDAIVSIEGAGTYCQNSSVTLTGVSAAATGTITYQWEYYDASEEWSPIAGANTSSFNPSTAVPGETVYRVYFEIDSAVCNDPYSSPVSVIIDSTSVGGTISGEATVCAETNSTLLTLSGHTGSVIRWQYSTDSGSTWNDIDNTSDTYTATDLTDTTQFRAVVQSGVCPEAFSSAATITVDPAPVPGDVTGGTNVCTGTNSTLLTLSGYTGSVIRWQYSTDSGSTWNDIDNTSDTYTATDLTDTTQFRAVVQSGVCPEAFSSAATITVDPVTVPGDVTGGTNVCTGTNSTLLTLSGHTGSVIRWQYSTDSGSTWNDIDNTSDTYTATDLTDTTQFRAVVQSGVCPEAFSSAATITVDPAPVPGDVTGGTNVCTGTNSTLLTLSGYTGSVIRWQYSTDSGSTWNDIDNTSDTYTATDLTDTTQFRAVVQSGVCPEAFSSAATITVDPVTVPGDVTGGTNVCTGTNSTLLTLSGHTGSVIRWQYSTDSGSTWNDIDNTSDTYTATDLTDTTQFRAVAQSGVCPEAFSSAATITVDPVTEGGTASDNQTICFNTAPENITLTGNTGNIIRWERSEDPSFTDPVSIPVTTSTLTGTDIGDLTDTTYFRAVVQSGACSVDFSSVVTINVTPDNTISLSSAAGTDAQTVCINTPITSILYATTGATGATITGLPEGVTGSWDDDQVTISGTPAVEDATFTYTVTLTGGCGTISTTGFIAINPTPTVNKPADQEVCVGESIAAVDFDGTGTSYSWTNDNTSIGLAASGTGNIASFIPVNTGSSPIVANITVTPVYSGGGIDCYGISQSFTITVIPSAQVDDSPDQTLCHGDSSPGISFTTSNEGGVTTFNWTNSHPSIGLSANGTGDITSFIATNNGSSPITATITVTPSFTIGGTSCTGPPQTILITVNPLPAVSWPSLLTNQCVSNTTYTLSGGFPDGGEYSGPGVTETNFNASVAGTGTHILTYTYTDTTGCIGSTTNTIIVNDLPSATISYPSSPYCATGTATVTRTGYEGGSYSSNPGLDLVAATGTINLATSTPGTYTVVYSFTDTITGCSNTASAPVTVNPLPTATISYPGNPFCTSSVTAQDVELTGTGAYSGGVFTSSPSGLSIDATTGAITPAISTPGVYTVTYTIPASGGCSAIPVTTSVTITALPTANISYGGNPFCNNITTPQPVTLIGTGAYNVGTFSSIPSGLTIDSSTGAITPSTSTPRNYSVSYTIPAAGGCAEVVARTSVTITALPSASISYSGSPFCTSQSIPQDVTINGSGAYTGGQYTVSPEMGLSINSETGAITPSSSTPGTYTVTYTIPASGGCASIPATTTVVVTAMPTVSISYPGSPYCSSTTDPQSVTISGTGAYTGGTFSSFPTSLAINPSTGEITPASSTPTTYMVTYTLPASGGCGPVTAFTILTITRAPSASISYAGTPFCTSLWLPQTVTLEGTGAYSGGTYSASPAGLTINSSTGTISPRTSTPGTYTVTYTIPATGGCSAIPVTTNVTVTAPPTASINYPDSPFCKNSTNETVTLTGTGAYLNGTYTASPAGLTINSSTGAINPSTSTAGTYTVIYTTPASGGCLSTIATTTVIVSPEFVAPTICCDQFFCGFNDPSALTITYPTTGYGSNVTYQWWRQTMYVLGWGYWTSITGANSPTYSPPQVWEGVFYRSRYRLVVTDTGCSNQTHTSNTVEITVGSFSLTGTFGLATIPEDPFCPDAGFRLKIQSESLAGLAKRTISYRWTTDPNHITPSSGEVAGSKDPNNKYVWIGEIPLVAHNNTSNQIVSTITVIPVVYEANGNLACELEPEEYDVTILPYAIVCPDDIEADITNPALCNISITTENPTYSNCVSPTDFSWSMTGATTGSGTGFVGTREFNLGTTTVTYTAANDDGSSSQCSFEVTVNDPFPPVHDCPDNMTVNTDPDMCSAVVHYALPDITDNCVDSTVVISQIAGLASGSVFPAGVTTNTFVATDASGNVSEPCSFSVTVVDAQDPVIISPGQLTVSCPSKIPANATDYSSFVALGGVASDNCSEVTVSWVSDIISNQTCSNRYTVTRTYLATDAQGNSSTCEQIITVNDQTAPVIQTTPGSLDDILECSDTTAIALALALEPAAIDNCNDSPTLHLINDVTTPTIPGCSDTYTRVRTWNFTDDCGNASPDFVQTIVVYDNTPPVITAGTINACYPTRAEAEAAAINATSAIDNCSSAVTFSASTSGTCSAVVTVSATDACGNRSQVTYNTRIDNTPPSITTGTIAPCYPTVGAAQAAALAATSVTDNCSSPSQIILSVSTSGTCPATITVTAVDGCGLSASATYTTVIDNTPPVITAGSINACYPTRAEAEAAAINATSATDNCAPAVTFAASTSGTCSAVVTVSATDACGNRSQVTYNTRIDNRPPVITAGSINACYPTRAEAEAAAINATSAIDNCSSAVTFSASTSGTCNAVVTVSATDACGNRSQVTYNTRIDNTPPVITAGSINACYPTRAEAEAAALNATSAIDNCSSAVTFSASTSGTCNAVVTVSATDACGNRSQVTYNIRIDNIPPVINGSISNITVEGCDQNAATVPEPANTVAQLEALGLTIADACTPDNQLLVTHQDAVEGTCPVVITRTYTVTDLCGNAANTTSTITIVDGTPPAFSCPSNPQIRIIGSNETTYTTLGNEFDFTSLSDDCGIATATHNLTHTSSTTLDGYIFGLDDTEVTWTAIDECGNSSSCSFTVRVLSPGIIIEKTVDYTEINAPALLTYTITVTNTGNVSLPGVVLTDDLAGAATLTSGDDGDGILEVGEAWVYTATYNATQDDIDLGTDLVNTASVVTNEITTPVTDNATTTINRNAAMTVEKSVDHTEINAPTLLTYTITVTNTGNVSLPGMVLTDDLAGAATLTSGDDGDGILEVGEAWVYTATYNATQDDIDLGTDLVNTASVITNEITTPVTDNATTTINRNAAMTVEKSVDHTEINAPTLLTYTITVTNTGNVSLTGVVLTDDLAGAATLTSGDDGDGILEVGEAWVYTATYNATQYDIDLGTDLVNTASVVTNEITTPVTDNATTIIDRSDAMTVEKSVDHTEINAPTLLTYTITVTNTGNVSLTGVVLTDDLAGAATLTSGDDGDGILEVGEAWVYTATYEATQDDIDLGTDLVNTASVVTNEITTPVTDNATTTINRNAAMTVEKVVDSTEVSAPTTLTYTITVTNTGNVSLPGVVLTDDLAGAATLTSGDDGDGILEVGEAWVYTATYNATQDDIDLGTDLVNTASVITNEITTPVTDNATTTINRNAAMTVEKVVDSTEINAPTLLTYTITVTNTGNVSLTGVVLTDDLAGAATLTSGDDGDGILEVGEAWVYTATYNATQNDIDLGTDLVNTASVVTNEITAPVTDNATTTINRNAAMTVEKVVDSTEISAPTTLTYTITVTNTGNVSLTGVVLTDDLAGAATLTSGDDGDGILEVGEAWVYTATYNATQDNIDLGTDLVNTASVVTNEITTPVTDNATTTINRNAAMTVEKVVDSTEVSAPTTLTYTITVTNTGNVSLTGVVLTDDLAGAATLTSGDDGDGILEVGEAWVYTATYNATQNDIDLGTDLVNTASVVTNEITAPVTDNATTTINRNAAMTVEKVVDSTEISAPTTLTYTITVTNTGNVSLTGVVLTDDLAGAATLTSGDDGDGILEVGEAWVYTATYNATQDDIDLGNDLVNTASVVTNEITTPVTDNATTTINRNAAMTVEKVVDSTEISAPGTLTYTITVTNTGNVSLPGVVLTDDLAGAATLTSGDDGDGILEVGEAWVYTATYNATQDDIDLGTDLVNTASVITNEITTPVTDNATTTINRNAAMTVEKVVDSTEISAPTTLTYTITVTNTGNVSLTGVVLTDAIVGGSELSTSLQSGDTNSNNILDVGEVWVYTATYNATQDDIDLGTDLVNTASVVTNEITTPVTDNATTTINRNAAMTVEKVVDSTEISAPGTLTYTITVTNTGNVSLPGVVLTDDLAGAATLTSGDDGDGILEVGEAWVYTATYNATQDDIDLGTDLVNTASVITNEITTPVTDNATTTINRNAAMTVEKVVDSTEISAPTTLTYTITVTNTGNVSLPGMVLTDDLAGAATLTSGDDGDGILEVGEAWVYTATYNATQDDIDLGTDLVNTASVITNEITTPVTDNATTTINRNAAMTVEKVVDSTEISAPTTLTYTITVTNTGNVSLTGVVLTDAIVGGSELSTSLQSGDTNSNNILDVGEVWVYTATYNATQDDIDLGTDLVNTASVITNEITTPVTDNAATTINRNAAMTVEKSVDHTEINAPTLLTYTITVSNIGNISLTGVVLTDAIVGGPELSTSLQSGDTNSNNILDVGETWSFTATYDATQNDIDAGTTLVNRAVADTDHTDPESAEASTTISQSAGWSMTKSAAEENYETTGDILHYTITLTNDGNVSIGNIVVIDPGADAGIVKYENGDTDNDNRLDPDETWTFSAIHTVTMADIISGTIVNIAQATGFSSTTAPVDAISDTVTVQLRNLPPTITCPAPIITETSASTCDTLITGGLAATYDDPNNNIATVTWEMTGATTAISPATGINDITSFRFNPGITTVTYTVTDAFGLSATCSFTITVEENTAPVAACRDIDVYLDPATGIATITASDIDNGSYDNCTIASLSVSRTEFNCTDLGANAVILTVTDAAGNSSTCEATVTVHYSVDPNPAVTPDNTVICNGGTINLALTSQIPSTTWTWHVNSPAGITGTSDDNSGQFTTINQTIFNSAPVAQQLTYNITPRVYGACDLEQITASVRVNPTPVIEANSADTILCYGDATVINIHNMNPHVKGKWVYDLQVEAEPGISGFSASSRQTSPTDLTERLFNTATSDRKVVYSFTPRIILPDGSQECEGETVTVTLTVHPLLTYNSELSDYNGYNISCFGYHNGSIRLTPTVDLAPFTYTWRGPNGYLATNDTGYVSDLYAGDYIITITDRHGCNVIDTITLTEPDKLSMTYLLSESNDMLFNINCHGAGTGWAAIDPVNNVGAVNYVWLDYTTHDSLRTNMKAGIYDLTIIDANNCRADSTLELTEPPAIELTFNVVHTYCSDMPDGEIALTPTGGSPLGGYTFQWSNGETTQDLVGILPGLYTVDVTDYNGCAVSGSILVKPKNEMCLIIPKAFSPNGDGYNDTWEIENNGLYPDMKIKIFNRWGQKLWESENGYPHPWDGRSNGVRLPIDSYHYTIEINNNSKPIIGTITIVYSSNDR